MAQCVLCRRLNTLVQSDDCMVYEPVLVNDAEVWMGHQALVMWCKACFFVGEVAPRLQHQVRELIPRFEVNT